MERGLNLHTLKMKIGKLIIRVAQLKLQWYKFKQLYISKDSIQYYINLKKQQSVIKEIKQMLNTQDKYLKAVEDRLTNEIRKY